jgi:hypothetical protein
VTPRTRNNAYAALNSSKLITGKKSDRSLSSASKYSAVVFTNPIEKQISPPKNEPAKASESEDDYSEDDFDDDFEPYETSNEGDKPPSGESIVP